MVTAIQHYACMHTYTHTHTNKTQPYRNDLDLQLGTIRRVTSKAAENLLIGYLPHIKGERRGALHHSSMTQYYIPTYMYFPPSLSSTVTIFIAILILFLY